VQRLSQEEGINLAGIKRILDLENQVTALQQRLVEMRHELDGVRSAIARQVAEAHASHRRDLVPLRQTAVLSWQSGHLPQSPGRVGSSSADLPDSNAARAE
jgi:MerR family transcriptional regulator/heat shock protein HspR